jgi:hypothetical protein
VTDGRVTWVTVERFATRVPAELLAAHLRGSGIEARVHGDDAGGTASYVGLLGSGIAVLVPAEEAEDARELIEDVARERDR